MKRERCSDVSVQVFCVCITSLKHIFVRQPVTLGIYAIRHTLITLWTTWILRVKTAKNARWGLFLPAVSRYCTCCLGVQGFRVERQGQISLLLCRRGGLHVRVGSM